MTNEEKEITLKQAMEDGKRFEYLGKKGVDFELAEAICWMPTDFLAKNSRFYSLDEIELAFESIAELEYDGHYTLLRFTTGFKAAFGTPDLRTDAGAEQVWELRSYLKAKDAMIAAMVNMISFY